MKTLLVLFFALVLILVSFEANGKRVSFEDRQLLSDVNLGRKLTAGPADKKAAQNPEANKANTGAATAQAGEVNRYDDSYNQDSGSESHRYFPCVTKKSKDCR